MSEEEKNEERKEQKIIDEANYQVHTPRQKGPAAVGRGGDPFFRNINAPREQIKELLEETTTVQDWIQRETSNNVAIACLNNENLKELYYEMKDGFGEYGPMMLMGFKTPSGVEIPRLKLLDNNGEVIEVLTGPLAMDELNKRALAFKSSAQEGDLIDNAAENMAAVVQDSVENTDNQV